MSAYDDDYPTCEGTHATLRFYHEHLPPDIVTNKLGIEPTKSQRAGDRKKSGLKIKLSGWFLCSKNEFESKDVRRHIDWILDRLTGLEREVIALQDDEWNTDVFCFWLSIGQGGPMLDPIQMERLLKFRLTCGFDIYFNDNGESGPRD